VAITFRSKWGQWNAQCMVCHDIGPGAGASDAAGKSPANTADAGSLKGATLGEGSGPAGHVKRSGPNSAGAANAPPAGSDPTRRGEFWSKIEDRVLLGDLHVKQGRYREALDAYGKAAETLEEYVNNTWHWDKEQVKASRELYGKLIQVHLAMGDNEEAKKVMARIDKIPAPRLSVEVTLNPSAPGKQAATLPAALPAKLIVTATKQQLDQVASGKMTFEEFKKVAKVVHQAPGEQGRP
jgi:tetratricopeptide (TPR) repeat protein